MSIAKEIRESLLVFADPEKASVLQGFFKTAKGAYGEGDKFVGIPVPKTRSVAKQYVYVAPEDVLPSASVYLEIYFSGVFGLLVYNMGSAILRAVGDSNRPLYFLIVASIVNIVLDIVFLN